jgi:hypothetical protein
MNKVHDSESQRPGGFTIFRREDALDLAQSGIMAMVPYSPEQAEGMRVFRENDVPGGESKVLINLPGFSLVHAWFKRDYPLPLHSHDSDCLYYIVSGSLRLGTQELGPQEGFFIPSGVPYTYTPGSEGVEVLEFRHETQFDFKLVAKGEGFFRRAGETIARRREEWASARRPSAKA